MIWSYLIHLGVHFWKKPGGDNTSAQLFKELPTEDEAWREIVDYIASQGFNTLLIDLGEGVQYESHPELATKGAWSKEKLKKELDRLRKNDSVSTFTLDRLCKILDCRLEDIAEYKND